MVDRILQLLKTSRSLPLKVKEKIFAGVPSMTPEELQTVEAILQREDTKARDIEHRFLAEARKLDEEYEQVLRDFQTHTLPRLRADAEETQRSDESGKAESALEDFS